MGCRVFDDADVDNGDPELFLHTVRITFEKLTSLPRREGVRGKGQWFSMSQLSYCLTAPHAPTISTISGDVTIPEAWLSRWTSLNIRVKTVCQGLRKCTSSGASHTSSAPLCETLGAVNGEGRLPVINHAIRLRVTGAEHASHAASNAQWPTAAARNTTSPNALISISNMNAFLVFFSASLKPLSFYRKSSSVVHGSTNNTNLLT